MTIKPVGRKQCRRCSSLPVGHPLIVNLRRKAAFSSSCFTKSLGFKQITFSDGETFAYLTKPDWGGR